jgi:hypothetical protein
MRLHNQHRKSLALLADDGTLDAHDFLLCRRHLGASAVDPVPRLLRQPALIFARDPDHEEVIVLVNVRREPSPNALSIQWRIDEPSRSEMMPPNAAAFDCFI